jgi:hypothetical protein
MHEPEVASLAGLRDLLAECCVSGVLFLSAEVLEVRANLFEFCSGVGRGGLEALACGR